MKLPFDPNADPVDHDPPYKRVDHLRPSVLPKIIDSAEDVDRYYEHLHRYIYNPAMDQYELKNG